MLLNGMHVQIMNIYVHGPFPSLYVHGIILGRLVTISLPTEEKAYVRPLIDLKELQ